MPAGEGSTRQDGGHDRNRAAEGLYLENKGQPATTYVSTEPSATAKGHSAGPSAASHGVTAATTASAIPAHVTSGNMNVGNQASNYQVQSDSSSSHVDKLTKEEQAAADSLPHYPELNERFQLLMKMGDGAFSNVYKARDRKTGQKVAIKVVRKYELNSNQDGRLDPQFRKKNRVTERANILKEVQIMRNLKHPGIVKLLEFSESREHYYLILELLEGGELFHQIVKLTYFSEALARHVILQVANGIRYLHEERGVVHRDIKPENLLFESIKIIPSKVNKARPYDEEKEDEGEFMPGIGGGGIGLVKIADFGLSKVVWEESTMTPCGTVGYTAPEIVKDERYSKSVDMWALGCVLYTLLCGFPPFYDESISVLTEKVAKGYYTFLSPWWDDISSSAKNLITHLLCVDSSKRFTIDEFLAHPWCNVQEPVPNLDSADIALAKMSEMPLDSPMLASFKKSKGRAMMSPGINQLKEAFDVTYAVHRMEEEGARRRGAGGQKGLQGIALNEDDEEEDQTMEVRHANKKYGSIAAQAIENHAKQSSKASSQAAAAPAPQQQQYQGRGGADRKLAEAALYDGRAGTRDRGNGRSKRGFELNMGNATLLGRRNKGNGAPGQSIGQFLDPNHSTSGDMGTHGLVPGSPMKID
ncbi:hypothetical protein CBS101457_001694 [Exobasidium rhododendri]|nr:hypothetical protein CBS101457_001694 [Exobasidium rhododendri]